MLPGVMLLLLLLLRWSQAHGKGLLAPPGRVRFEAETFQHVLRWEAPPGAAAGLRYDVQYRRYGERDWTPVGHCTRVASRACDLSEETWDPSKRYYAHVRALAGNRTSGWALSIPFHPPEATLRLQNMELSVSGNVIHVSLQLPRNRHANLTYEAIHRHFRQYRVHVRRDSNNHQAEHVKTSLNFDIPGLLWGELYCVQVEPVVVSRPTPAWRTEEQCVTIPPCEDDARTAVAISSLILLTLASLGTGLASAYVKKPAEAPAVLKSLQQSNLPTLLPDRPLLPSKDVVLCVEPESVQQLCFLGLKDLPELDSLSLGSDTTPFPADQKTVDISTCSTDSGSTDSGICLQHPPGSLSLFWVSSWASLGSDKEEGISAEEQLLQMPPSSMSAEPQARDAEEELQAMDPTELHCFGYQKQSRACSEEGVRSLQAPSNMDKVAHSVLCLPTGYLKQTSLATPSDPEAGDGSRAAALCQQYNNLEHLEAIRNAPWIPQALLGSEL